MARSSAPAAAALLILGVLTAGVNAQVIYFEDFENEASWPEWSTSRNTSAYPTFTRFLGRFINERATLSITLPLLPQDETNPPAPPPPPPPAPTTTYMLDFTFYCIDSWDGSDTNHGPDRFSVLINNNIVFSETFSNQHELQSYRQPDIGPMHLGFDARWMDSIYYISIPFTAPAGATQIAFEASGLHGAISDESWGIDNVTVRIAAVPTPGAAALALLALATAGARRRRQA